jgi:branched-chain amino acid transport system substrate-binding protein
MQNQSAQWLQIRREKPRLRADVGLGRDERRRAHRSGEDQISDEPVLGIWWSGHDAT